MKKTAIVIAAALLSIALLGCAKKDVKTSGNNASSTTVSSTTPDAATLVSKNFIDPLKDWSKYDNLIKEIKAETNYENRTLYNRLARLGLSVKNVRP